MDKYNLLYVYRIEKLAGNSLHSSVLFFIIIVIGISQLVNSGIFMACGFTILIWFGVVLLITGLLTIFSSSFLSKYSEEHYSEPFNFQVSSEDVYAHPYTSYIE